MDNEKDDELQAHGMTHKEMRELAQKQVNGEVETIPANRIGDIKDEFFKKDYEGFEIPDHEKNSYHVAQEMRNFDRASGARLSTPQVQVYNKASFDFMKKNNGFDGMTIEILHTPENLNEETEKKKQEASEKRANPVVSRAPKLPARGQHKEE